MNEKEFIEKFEAMSLPSKNFNHIGHLWLAWLYIRNLTLDEAVDKLNKGIKQFAISQGAKDKFHYTITSTLACAVRSRFKKEETFEEFIKSNNDLVENAIFIIGTHYSPELLFSAEAKANFVKPDKEPFPQELEKQLKSLSQPW